MSDNKEVRRIVGATPKMTMKTSVRRLVPVVVAMCLAASTAPATAQTTSISARQREAAALERQIESRGEALSVATEDYNAARLERERLDGRLARLRAAREEAARRYGDLKQLLGTRAKALYMHPGSWATPYMQMEDVNGLARAQVLSSSVLGNDSDLLLRTAKARNEIELASAEVDSLKSVASSKEKDLQSRRVAVSREMTAQKQLLSQVKGDLAQLVEAERERKAAAAAAAVLRQQPSRTTVASGSSPRATPGPAGKPVDAADRVSRAGPARPTAAKAVATAAAQMGKPYEWGAAGPGSYDCSGLTMYAWASAGVSLPHSSRAQFAQLPKVSIDEVQPGDLLFYGSPIHHVGIYEGNGTMISAPQTGDSVKRSSIYRKDFTGAGRP